MPGRNQTGPNGMGPFTGRGMGMRGNRIGFGYGFGGIRRGGGFGRGNGYGFHHNYYYNENNVTEKEFLENELKIMKEHVAQIEKQLENYNR